MALNTRKPTGKVSHPFILLEGEEKAGKSFNAAKLAESKRIGRMFWIDLGEGTGDEYADADNPLWEIVVHDGTYKQVMDQLDEVRQVAAEALEKGEPPVVLIIDTISVVWDALKDWVTDRALASRSGKAQRRDDPEAEVKPTRNQWNDANTRVRRLMTKLMTFPGIVVATGRGKLISDTDPATGQPYRDGRKTWTVEGPRNLMFDVDHVIRLTRTAPPLVVGCRTKNPTLSIRPGTDDPISITHEPENLLDWFIFDALGYNPQNAQVRDLVPFTGGGVLPEERTDDDAINFGGQQTDEVVLDEFLSDVAEAIKVATPAGRIDALRDVYTKFGERTLRAMHTTSPAGAQCTGLELINGWVDVARKEIAAHAQQSEQQPAVHAQQEEPARAPEAEPARAEQQPEPAQEPAGKVAADEYQSVQTARANRPDDLMRRFVISELEGQAAIFGVTPDVFVESLLREVGAQDVSGVNTTVLRAYALKNRAGAIERMRAGGRVTEADAYARVTNGTFRTWDVLTGTAGVDEPAQEPVHA